MRLLQTYKLPIMLELLPMLELLLMLCREAGLW